MQNGLLQRQSQTMTLAPQMRQGLKMLAMSLPELRSELVAEMARNPVIDDIEHTLEKTTISDRERAMEEGERVSDYPEDDNDAWNAAYLGGIASGPHGSNTEAIERREKFFENQVKVETLEEHLLGQLPLSDIEPADLPLAEMLIGDLDDNGYFAGSIPDVVMVSGESEKKICEILDRIKTLDPAGCGSRTHQECLLSQLDSIGDPALRARVRRLIEAHWQEMADGRLTGIFDDLGVDRAGYAEALKALRTLEPYPGRSYRKGGRGAEYVNPEVHLVRCADGWNARVDARSLPEIRISSRYLAMLEDPAQTAETKAYIRERIAAAKAIVEAVAKRHDTIEAIAQEIFDRQPGFFEKGLKGLKPMTMQEVADAVGVHLTTVSRTVNGKYAATPKGTVELRRLFTQGLTTDSGEEIARDGLLDELRKIVDAEDKAHPLSDEKISEKLKEKGFPVARRTVAKYRGLAHIPGAAERRR